MKSSEKLLYLKKINYKQSKNGGGGAESKAVIGSDQHGSLLCLYPGEKASKPCS